MATPAGPASLRGLTFLNPREAGSAPALTQRLTALGAAVVEAPTIAFVPPEDWTPFDTRVRGIGADDWVVFTSATAVRFVLQRLRELGLSAEALRGGRIACVGRGTERALTEAGLPVALVPRHFQQEGLLEALRDQVQPTQRVWLPRAGSAREALEAGLRELGVPVEVTTVYRTVAPDSLGAGAEALRAGRIDWLLFTSPSTVHNFLALLPTEVAEALKGHWPRVACLGAVTAEAARKRGLAVAVVPEQQDLDGLVAAVVDYMANASGPAGR